MQCETIMKRSVVCVSPKETAQQAATRMRDENVGFLPVCGKGQKVLGTVTDRDITVRLVASGMPPSMPVQDVMTSEVVSCRPHDDLSVAQDLMARYQKSRIMCIDEAGTLVGIISLSDIARHEQGLGAADTLREVAGREARA